MNVDDLKTDDKSLWEWPCGETLIDGITLKLTCGACPEQYDAFSGGELVGYLRLRHGKFRVEYPDCGGETIYFANPKGDGMFDDDEREFYLKQAVKAINEKLEETK